MTHRQRAALGALVAAFALLFAVEGALLPAAWLPVEEAAALERARGRTEEGSPSEGVLYAALLAPAVRSLPAPLAHDVAKGLSALLWAAVAMPAYLLARRLVSPGASLVVAGLTVAAPASVYATAAVPDGLALVLAAWSLPVVAKASERGSRPRLLAGLSLGAAAAIARPWLAVLPAALLLAYALPRVSWRSLLRWPRSLVFAIAAAGIYSAPFLLAAVSPGAGAALSAPASVGRAALASLVVAAVGIGLIPWLLAFGSARPAVGRPEWALLAACTPALGLSAGVLGAGESGGGLDERPLLALVPLVMTLAAAAWTGGGTARLAPAAAVATLIVLASVALPSVERPVSAWAAGLTIVAPDGGSRAALVAGTAVAAVAALVVLAVLGRRHRALLPAALAVLFLVAQMTAWSTARAEARGLAAVEPVEPGWVDHVAGRDARVVIVTPRAASDERSLGLLTVSNRRILGVREVDPSTADPETGFLGESPEADLLLVRGVELVGEEIAHSSAGALVRPDGPLRLAETIEGLFDDGWSGSRVVYRRFSGTSEPGTVVLSLSRASWGGEDRPGHVVVESGPLAGEAAVSARAVVHAGEELDLEIDVPRPPFRIVVTIEPTFSPAEFGEADERQLGAVLRFAYRGHR